MGVTDSGYSRPTLNPGPMPDPSRARQAVERFRRICPGVGVQAPDESPRDRYFGSALGVWEAWATDGAVRHAGSSGGTITAICQFLLEDGYAERVDGIAAGKDDPALSVASSATASDMLLPLAGSRYAPSPSLAHGRVLHRSIVAIAKPCEASALRAMKDDDRERPLLVSFFCAGVPSQRATEELSASLGVDPNRLVELRYRGNGWPGCFVARDSDGNSGVVGYDRSWGQALGPTVQWRCKLCPDGVGEAADIVAGDYWEADEAGYPLFSEGDGRSVLIARTARGLDVVQRALAAGVVEGRPLNLNTLRPVQPLQVERRTVIAGRLAGARLAGLPVPRAAGFGLVRFALRHPIRNLRAAKGTFSRARRPDADYRRSGPGSTRGGA